jgi:uncharacterized membrane protein (UPF0127 family)
MQFNTQKHVIFCQKATSFRERTQGLIGKNPPFLPLYIPKCRNIHTFFMKRPLFLLWLDNNFKVIQINNLTPWKIKFCPKAKHIIEFGERKIPLGIKIGDVLFLHHDGNSKK